MKKAAKPEKKTCSDCTYEGVCLMWCHGNALSPENAPKCPNYCKLKDSLEYRVGYADGKEREWDLFDLITSVYHGKQYYFRQNDGQVYSRDSEMYLSFGQAIDEFCGRLNNE